MIEYFRADDLRSPASETEINQLEKDLGFNLPSDYREFLLLSDGYNGEVGDRGYAQIWSIGELTSNNEGYEVKSWVPDLALIVSIPFVPMARDEVRRLGGTFAEFLAALSAGEGW
jgi:SMI1 / KNR4 family (SUKH-1)